MKTIFDPSNRWIGKSPLVFSQSNKRPVAVDDVVSVAKDSGAISIAVLTNDFDPELGPLALVSAVAAIGTAVAETNDTVTYTPPAGIAGFDTVLYTISDDQGQTTEGQINIAITEAQLSVDIESGNIIVVTAEAGPIDVTITEPVGFAGTTSFDTGDFSGGPVNLIPPDVSGTVTPGQVLTALNGL